MCKKKQSLYFIEKPIERKEKDLIGISKQVEYLKEAIRNGARFIGIISGFSSGKSSITNKLKYFGYKTVKINMWKEVLKQTDEQKKDVTVGNGKSNFENAKNSIVDTEECHKDFLYQLAMRTGKMRTQYLLDRYSNNGKKIKIISKTKKMSTFFIWAIAMGALAWLTYNEVGKQLVMIVLKMLNFDNILCYTVYTGILWIFVGMFCMCAFGLIYALVKDGAILSFWGTDTEKISKSEMIEIFNSIIGEKNAKARKKYIIIVEDIDRINNTNISRQFIRELYEMYYKNNDESVLIIEVGKQYASDSDKNDIEKFFDVILECGEIDFTNADVKLLESLLETKTKALKKIGINIKDENIKWDLLCRGKNITIRKLKHRYNKVILKYETLRQRFPSSKILINTCLVIVYLLEEYATETEQTLKEKIKKQLDLYEKDLQLLSAEDINKEIAVFIKQGMLTEEYNRYINNYPQSSVYRTEDETAVYYCVLNNDIEGINNVLPAINRVKKLENVVEEALARRMKTHPEIPEVVLENKELFKSIILNDEWKTQFNKQFLDENDDKKILYIRKLVNYNLGEMFWKQLLSNSELNTYEFRNELYQYEECVINVEQLLELYRNDEDPIRADEMKKINKVYKVLRLINVLKDKELKLKKINELFEQIKVREVDVAEIGLFVDDLCLGNKINDKDELARALINIIENKKTLRSKQLNWLILNLDGLGEETIKRIVYMLNNKLNFGELYVEELVLKLAQRNKKYGLNKLYTSMLLTQGYYCEYLICKALYEGILEDSPEIAKDVFVRVFKEYYNGENLNIAENALVRMYEKEIILSESWHKIKVFVGVINSIDLYRRMVELIAEGNNEVIEYFDKFESLTEEENYELVSYIDCMIQNKENKVKLKEKMYGKVKGRSRTKLTNCIK